MKSHFLTSVLAVFAAILLLFQGGRVTAKGSADLLNNQPESQEPVLCRPNALIDLGKQPAGPISEVVRLLREAGGCVKHVFPPRFVIGFVPESFSNELIQHGFNPAVYSESLPTDYFPETPWIVQAWNQVLEPQVAGATQEATPPTGSPLVNEVRPVELPIPPASAQETTAGSPSYYQTSEFMAGSVAVGIILPESDGSLDASTENWDTTRINNVVSKIQSAMSWWDSTNPAGNLSFYYDIHSKVATKYEPINRSSSEDTLWINETLGKIGYASGEWYSRSYSYLNALRNQYHTDWAVVVFVVDSYNDSNGMFTDGYFGYTYGFLIVMTYDNDGWGISNMNSVMAHEFAHDFGAGDEYCSPGYACCYGGGSYGYLGIPNSNCVAGCDLNSNGMCDGNDATPNSNCHNCPTCQQVNSLMRQGSIAYGIDSVAAQQVGMRDTDGDGILDPLDTSVSLTVNSAPSNPTYDTTLTYSGSTQDIPYDLPNRSDEISINTITTVEYNLDGGQSWLATDPADGAFDELSESFSFTTQVLTPGFHTINIRAINRSGIYSSTYSNVMLIGDPQSLPYHLFLPNVMR